MKNIHRFLALLLSLGLAGVLTGPAGAIDEAGGEEPVRAVVIFEENAGDLTDTLAALPGTEVLWEYDVFFSGAAIEAPENVLRALEDAEGVRSVGRSASHDRPMAVGAPLAPTNSLPAMGAGNPEYAGDGMVIAVLDDSLRVNHEAFQDYGQVKGPALSKADVAAFASKGGAEGKWYSDKLPFVYDYAGEDTEVTAQVTHGTHVSALAAGYAQGPDGTVTFTGAAPAAQLVFMKVFTDGKNSRADDAVILRAMEDAYKLGADVINLSLGTDNGFTEDDILEEVYGDIFLRLREEGVLVFCAAGNSGTVITEKAHGVPLPSTSYTDYGSTSSPGTYLGAVSVAAADAMERESAGGIQAGERRWAFVDSDPDEGCSAPSLDTLADKELRYIPVGGMGRPEDYEGLDVTGAVVLVERGEITFTEKTRNAANAGAVACLVYNNTVGGIIPSVEDLSIPCAVISKDAGAALLRLAEEGEAVLTIREDAYMETVHEDPAIYEYSAWGTTSDLRLVPMITAPGGSILSAGGESDSAYEYLSGTSMASPNAAGAAAGLLQAIKARQPELSRAQRGALALSLLESTATLIRDTDSGAPISPRRQGAGVVNQEAAIAAQAVIEEPLLELGESKSGIFTASFRVRNLTEEPLELTVTPQVLTDNWKEENGRTYSTLTPLDITDKVTVTGGEAISLPAGGSQEVTLKLQVTQAGREELGKVFPNGFFVEGYITLSGEGVTPVHAAFMGYCGDWSAAPILEPVTQKEVLTYLAETDGEGDWREEMDIQLGANLACLTDNNYDFDPEKSVLLGENLWGYLPDSGKYGAISTEDTQAMYSGGSMVIVEPILLRNAAHLIMLVQDNATGEIYSVDDTPWLTKPGVVNGETVSSGLFYWDGTDGDGGALPEGTSVTVRFYAWLDGDEAVQAAYAEHNSDAWKPEDYAWLTDKAWDGYLAWSFPVAIDGTAPTVTVGLEDAAGDQWSAEEIVELARTLPESGGDVLTITFHDEQYLAHAAVYGDGTEPLAELLFTPEKTGKTYVLRLSLEGLESLPEHLSVTVSDYASNTVGLDYDLQALLRGETAEPELCPAAMFYDVGAGSWYHEAVDYVFNEELMDGAETFAFQPQEKTSRAVFLEALYRAAGSPRASAQISFSDVPSNAWYRSAVRWAYEMGIAEGFDENTFGALAPLTRQQLAVMLYRSAALGGASAGETDLSNFADGDQVASWAREAVCWAVEEGILSGGTDGKLNPEGYATRGETAAIIMRYLEG